jgi:signal transduction histidine kinase/ActR/RegA family two-component response regulator/HPt (histidine-containing phosphotransfer) domain-containing protein
VPLRRAILRERRARRLLLAPALILVAGAAYTWVLIERQQALQEAWRYDIIWSTSQAVSELARLEQRIAATTVPGSGVDRDEVQLRLDVLTNRVGLFQSRIGAVEELIRSDPEFRETIDRLAGAIAAAQPLVDVLDRPGSVAQLLELFSPLDASLARLASAAQARIADRIAEGQRQLDRLHWIFSALLSAILLCSLALVVLLLWNNRLLQQAHREVGVLAEAAEQANRAKSEFLAMMSHEIRTPMTAVLGMADLLAAEDLDRRQRQYIDAVRSSGRHLLNVVNNILDLSQIEAGRLAFEQIDFSVAEVLEQIRSLVAPQAVERRLELRLTIDGHSPPVVRGDPTRLKQVLLNLVGNALKFTSRGTVEVRVRCRDEGEAVRFRFEVEDSGIGITAEQQAELFQPFVQAERSTTRTYGGSGLGLAISRRLVEAMGGAIGVESESGRGSIFWFEVTLALGDSVVVAEEATAGPASKAPLRVLVVEDVPAIRDLLYTMLAGQGHAVSLAENGEEAVRQAARAEFDVVVMDVQMPIMDGIEASRRIRRLPPPAGTVPIIALTANVFAAEHDRCLAAGMSQVLTKPVTWSTLFAALPAIAATEPRSRSEAAPPAGGELLGAAAPAEGSCLVDWPFLKAALDRVPAAKAAELLAGVMGDARSTLAELRAARERPREAARLAHRLAGTSRMFGLVRIGDLGVVIEGEALEGRVSDERLNALAGALDATERALAAAV